MRNKKFYEGDMPKVRKSHKPLPGEFLLFGSRTFTIGTVKTFSKSYVCEICSELTRWHFLSLSINYNHRLRNCSWVSIADISHASLNKIQHNHDNYINIVLRFYYWPWENHPSLSVSFSQPIDGTHHRRVQVSVGLHSSSPPDQRYRDITPSLHTKCGQIEISLRNSFPFSTN